MISIVCHLGLSKLSTEKGLRTVHSDLVRKYIYILVFILIFVRNEFLQQNLKRQI